MKKIAYLLILCLLFGVMTTFVSCKENNGNTADTEQEVSMSAVDALNNVWETYGEEEKFFAMGGDMNNMVDNAPGEYGMEDTETLSWALYIPADSIALVDQAASLMHAMNTNTFMSAAFHLTDAANAETLATSIKDTIMSTQWMCGFPDKVVMFTVNEDIVMYAFGNAELIDNFKSKVTTVYGENAVLLVEENIM